jgi:hypothetical protein
MSATATCVTPIKGSMYRLVKLDACGSPVTGASSMVIVSKGFVQVQMDPQYEDGTEFFERTADGTPCVNQMDDPVLKRFQLTMDFCEINQTGAAYMASMRELTTGGGATGVGFAAMEGQATNRWSLEVWQQVAGAGQCDPTTGLQRYIYNAWPNVGSAKLGPYSIALARSTLQIVGTTRAASVVTGIGWGDGPGATSWLPSGATAQSTDHWMWNVTTTAPPTPTCSPTLI